MSALKTLYQLLGLGLDRYAQQQQDELPPVSGTPASEIMPPPMNDPREINVNGVTMPQGVPEDDPAPRPMGNRSYIEEADAANKAAEQAAHHHGAFGVKGTLRDIFGLLGDASPDTNFEYRKAREGEQESDALTGFTADPLAAMERLSRVNAGDSRKMFDDYQQNMNRYAATQSLEASRKNLSDDRNYTNLLQGRAQLQRLLASATGPEQRAMIAQTYAPLIARQAGTTPEDLGVVPGMSDDDLQMFAHGDMTVNQQVQVPFKERGLDIQQQNADSNKVKAQAAMTSATRPRATSQRAQTELEYYQTISRKPESQQTPGEKAFVKKYLHGTKSSLLGDTPPPPPPGGNSTSRFRLIK